MFIQSLRVKVRLLDADWFVGTSVRGYCFYASSMWDATGTLVRLAGLSMNTLEEKSDQMEGSLRRVCC